MQIRYIAIAVVLILGCRKTGGSTERGGGTESGWSTPMLTAGVPVVAVPPAEMPVPRKLAVQGEACSNGTPCESGLSCLKYVGVTGASLSTCEIPCAAKGSTCPEGQTCTMLTDGPGAVCQPSPEEPNSDGGAGQGEPCPDGRCAAGLSCVKFYGIAGPRGGELSSCEIRCSRDGGCPGGQTCVTIADGPGSVCRPVR